MTLEPGARLGPYEILSPLGAGGMGEVYRARDERLGREVALKVLPAASNEDPERRQRFEQEARAAGALNHPNILAIHDVGDHEGTPFLVSELLSGETLRERLEATPRLPTSKAVDYAVQIARGLAAAHERGILHRDLKPDNLFITQDGGVKILDFGLAKLTQPDTPVDPESATRTRHTQPGTVLGTVGYMSPEQVRGQPVDHRSDIFSLGVVLYEMVAGRRAFEEDTQAETMTAILRHEPKELSDPEFRVSPGLEQVIRHCLEKKPEERFQSARDLAFQLQALSTGSDATVSAAAPRPRSSFPWRTALIVLGTVILALIVTESERREAARKPSVNRLALVLPDHAPPDLGPHESLALSPDGRQLVYAGSRDGERQLFLRPLDRFETTPIPGTEGGFGPFFSSDGQWLGFYAEGRLKKIPLSGGAPLTLADDTWDANGADWTRQGTIVFTRRLLDGLCEVSENGGTVTTLTTVDVDEGEIAHVSPQLMPGADSLLFTVWRQDVARAEILSRASGDRRVILEDAAQARYLESGHLVFVRHGRLMAARFDPEAAEVIGVPSPVLEDLPMLPILRNVHFQVSANGTLVFAPREAFRASVIRVDQQGREHPIGIEPGHFETLRVSPGGEQIALSVLEDRPRIWLYGLARGELERFRAAGYWPAWAPNGRRLAFVSSSVDSVGLFVAPLSGAADPIQLTKSGNLVLPGSWSPDGQELMYSEFEPEERWNIMAVGHDAQTEPRAVVATPFDEWRPAVSPDGRLVAYVSNEAGQRDVSKRWDVYVRPLKDAGPSLRVSTQGGGMDPVWSPDGRELFYREGTRLMVVSVTREPRLEAGTPRLVYDRLAPVDHPFDVAPDGTFVVLRRPESAASAALNVILGWFDELERQLPTS